MTVQDRTKEAEARLRDMPVLVTRADVLEHMAKICMNLANGLELGGIILDVAREVPDARMTNIAALWKSKLPAADLQITAALDAATYLQHLAAEDRILAARAAADQRLKEPKHG